jgi:hypothetical protein
MGVFDEVTCEYALPEWPQGEQPRFQTKDLECLMQRYRITRDGRLLSVDGRDEEYHGYVGFYTSLERAGGHEWFAYQAKFTDGRLVDIQRVSE